MPTEAEKKNAYHRGVTDDPLVWIDCEVCVPLPIEYDTGLLSVKDAHAQT